MITTTIKKTLAAMALLTLGLLPAPDADAYRQVCMKAKFGIGYIFKFRVAWGMDWSHFHAATAEGRPYHIDGVTPWSGDVHLVKNRCVSMDRVPANKHFTVQMRSGTYRPLLCKDWDNNKPFIARNAPERKTLWLDAWGSLPSQHCKAWKFD